MFPFQFRGFYKLFQGPRERGPCGIAVKVLPVRALIMPLSAMSMGLMGWHLEARCLNLGQGPMFHGEWLCFGLCCKSQPCRGC